MKRLFSLLFMLSATAFTGQVYALPVLSLDRITPAVIGVGEISTFELRISGLSSLLGAFSADISFDPAILGFVPAGSPGAQFGPLLGDPALEAVGTADPSVPGVLHLDEVSLLSSAGLDALQRDVSGNLLQRFVLANVMFQGVSGGLGVLDFVTGSVTLSDDAGTALATPALGPGIVRVVSSPGSAWLLGLGLVAMLMLAYPRTRRREV